MNVWYQFNLYVLLQNMKHTIRIDAVLYCFTCWYTSIRCLSVFTDYLYRYFVNGSVIADDCKSIPQTVEIVHLISSLDGVRAPLNFEWCALCTRLARFFSAYQHLALNCPIECSSSSLVYLWGGLWTGNFSFGVWNWVVHAI